MFGWKKASENFQTASKHKMHKVAWVLLCLTAWPAAALDFGRIAPDEVAVYVQDLNSGKVLASHRADEQMSPASTMKLVTTFAALRHLGADYRWLTEWKSPAEIKNGALQGDLYWVGSGNPVFDQRDLADMQQQLRSMGVEKIEGHLVFDRSIWQGTGSAQGFDDDAEESFVTPPDPQMLAYKVVWIEPQQGENGRVVVQTEPPLPDVPLESHLVLTDSSMICPSLKRFVNASYRNGTLHVGGRMPPSCLGQKMFVNMLDNPDFAAKSFINAWRAQNSKITSGLKIGKAPQSATTLAASQSKPLSEVLIDMNKESNNIIARSLFLTLGEQEKGGNTADVASKMVHRELSNAGVDASSLVLENGSGLSRRERVSARMMGEILAKAYHSSFQTAFIDSLPIGGVDGTLKNRFKNTHGLLHMKTGTLKDVRALAGYYLGAQPLAVVVLVNSERSGVQAVDIDRVVRGLLPH